ncbi:uncharacterized protein F4812DRAFT_42880 [Daldinia caldariorum]|uniref:uncharacterized protein n=1 Tax=Daldinia caldariorum TaxID=326644 RepID=UPI0020077CEB|nr:uncharacterized protein F4812DRAFT_42880 [Daldinia caldariorum]KAI1473216.1 hypothetical protein F4812DRAFT_42880 [Daldinia caldariorum]
MRTSFSIAALLVGTAVAAPIIPFVTTTAVIPLQEDGGVGALSAATEISRRQSSKKACFIIGSKTLPKEVADIATSLASTVSCDSSAKTISGVPDVKSGSTTFSSIDFSKSKQTGLQFALSKFATAEPLASTDLKKFQDMLNVYQATEAGIRSVGGSLAIKVPKFFLEMQVSRIQTAQGNPPSAPGLQVDHLRDKVLKNAPKESSALLNQVKQLATQLK